MLSRHSRRNTERHFVANRGDPVESRKDTRRIPEKKRRKKTEARLSLHFPPATIDARDSFHFSFHFHFLSTFFPLFFPRYPLHANPDAEWSREEWIQHNSRSSRITASPQPSFSPLRFIHPLPPSSQTTTTTTTTHDLQLHS